MPRLSDELDGKSEARQLIFKVSPKPPCNKKLEAAVEVLYYGIERSRYVRGLHIGGGTITIL
jgi:hypothetical protein